MTNNTTEPSNGPDFDSGADGPSPASMPDLERLRTIVIPMMRELVKACSSDFDINRFYMSIPARPDRDADLIMSEAIKYLEQLDLMGWVPVSERLPELGDIVDLFVDGERLTDYYLDHYSPTDHRLFWYPKDVEGRVLMGGDPTFALTDSDYWMPLPPLPGDSDG